MRFKVQFKYYQYNSGRADNGTFEGYANFEKRIKHALCLTGFVIHILRL